MQLEFRHGNTVVRVDGDVVEIFRPQAPSPRCLLAFWAVRVQRGPIKGQLVVRMTSASADSPLYEVQAKARPGGSTVEAVIPAEAEPLYRQFFTQVAQLCDRSV